MYNQRHNNIDPNDEVNILLLGQTGVGKTTFINAFVNFLYYNTLDDAIEGGMKVLTYSTFAIAANDKNETVDIKVGDEDFNECSEVNGESSTKSCRSYLFRIGNRAIRLIDAPGVGDTRGVEYEAINFQHILSYINNYEHLNGICFLFKPNETRLTIYFRYCLKELLRHLHVNAKDNIMFVFTNSRSTHFRPGDTAPLIKTLLKEIKQTNAVEIPFCDDNIFMFDNESFRFLAAHQQGIRYIMKDKTSYVNSWNKSVAEYSRLVIRILKCDLHAIKYSQSLNAALILIHRLSRPIAEITKLIEENKSLARQYKGKLANGEVNRSPNRIPQKTGVFVPLRERLTVCIDDKCTEIITVDGEKQVNYKTKCHVGCSLHRVVQECIGHPTIKRCRAFKRKDTCRNCGCHWNKHMHITYKYELRLTYFELNPRDTRASPKSIESLIDKRISDLENEQHSIRDICVALSKFIKVSSIVPFNDSIIEYLKHFLREKQQEYNAGENNVDIINGIKKTIEDYEYQMSLLSRSDNSGSIFETMNNFVSEQKIEEIIALTEKLYELPIYGKLIKEQIDKMDIGQQQAAPTSEKLVQLPQNYSSVDILQTLNDAIRRRRW